ncbi:hypothetical protein PPEP_a1065 [Pseudoalteromonas peptidolytica F12-50-A1]|uniref:Uncharacterized protein n=1 Tax=Pseudoalteromonas peptidolytica F12-50-A1 TaxID=1315280 RepID=A0A8I0MVR6_9GAMM|nr:hypothetical protein [Pseudoalteromonas peptidolytica F12-50-A1]
MPSFYNLLDFIFVFECKWVYIISICGMVLKLVIESSQFQRYLRLMSRNIT